MDRMTTQGRDALAAYREMLALEPRRVARNWAAIEARAGDETSGDDAADGILAVVPTPARGRNVIGVASAVVAVLAAAVAVITVGPHLINERVPSASGAAASYEAIEVDEAQTSVIDPERPAPARTDSGDATRVAPEPMPTPASQVLIDQPAAAVLVPAPTEQPAKASSKPKPPKTEPVVDPELDAAKRLVAEANLLGRARAALRDGDSGTALAATDEHSRRFGAGVLAEEIAFIRLSALCLDGRAAQARAVALSFARAYPGSPLAARAARTCASNDTPE